MDEIEVMILNIDKDAVEARLRELNASKIFSGALESFYFDFPGRQLKKEKSMIIRLRNQAGSYLFAVKKQRPSVHARECDEQEFAITDPEIIFKLMETLGMEQWLVLQKTRISYRLGDCQVDIDDYHGDYTHIPVFLEIEGPSVHAIHAAAAKLGFTPEECRPYGFLELDNHFKSNRG